MHNKRVPPKSHCGIFQIYQCAVADKYLELSHICGVKFHFKLRNGNWVYGFLAWFAYTHNNLLSLASVTEKGTCHICYCLQFLPFHKNANVEFYLFPKCTKCHSCGSNISRSVLGVKWFLGYTYQYACGEWFIQGNYLIVVEKACGDLEQKQICQSGYVTTHNILTFTTWISPLISLGSEYASDYESLLLVKEWILETFANTWFCFNHKCTALWNGHEQGIGETYLPAIYYTPKDQLLSSKNYFTDLFHGSLAIAFSIMLMRIDGVTYVEEFESSIDADTHTLLELLEESPLVLYFHKLQEEGSVQEESESEYKRNRISPWEFTNVFLKCCSFTLNKVLC
ncbi:unnamed protein product [Trifolium pratense]|uniref:Uncharacterized protein n=1 Tax=Trifolium pratense TaxID=57577 RepID=A0ACB0JRG2_TRIPR|nr:unnamed protein product [Trifolium pratense]